jgi:hypothetical protein
MPATATIANELRPSIHGRVITPDDPEYDGVRTLFVGDVDPRPAVIVQVADADDAARTIAFARETGMELAVRSGGHSNAAHSSVDGGVVLDVRRLDSLDVDRSAGTAWVGSGATAAAITSALAEQGLAIGFGDTGSVGVGGITLGGGVGYLVRKYGLTIDSLLAADIVTADGEQLRVDEASHPDLFWAIRGGGGNFGVVTRFLFRTHELDGVVGGLLILPATRDTITGFVAAADAAPDELSTIANVMPAPPMPFLPPESHGQLVILAMVTYAGPADAGQQAFAPFRALATPLADMVRPMSYAEMYPPEDESYHPKAVARTLFLDRFDGDVADVILERLADSDSPMRVAQLRVLGGALSRVPADATAYPHRDRPIMVNLASFYQGADDKPRREAWLMDFWDRIRQGDDHGYVNFLVDEGPARVRDAYPGATWDRLAEIKRRYDPTNLFHHNQNVPPAPVPTR